MNNKILIGVIGIVAAVALILGVLAFAPSAALSASGIGPTHYQAENFLQGLFIGVQGQFRLTNAGVVSSTAVGHFGPITQGGTLITSSVSSTLTGAQVCALSLYEASNTAANTIVTLPWATSTTAVANCLSNVGDSRSFNLWNNGTNTLSFATSTNVTISRPFTGTSTLATLMNGTTTPALGNSTSTGAWGRLTMVLAQTSTINYFLTIYGTGQ